MQIVLTFFFFLQILNKKRENDALKMYMLQISEKHCYADHQSRERKRFFREREGSKAW